LTSIIQVLREEQVEKPLKEYQLPVDPIAISCYMYENRLSNYTEVFQSLESSIFNTGFKDIGIFRPANQPKYIQHAEKIRAYYGQKFMMLSMRKTHMTRFRTQLFEYLTRADKSFTADHVGMIASLPRLYAEDSILETMRKNYNNTPWLASEPHGKEISTTLTFIDSHIKKAFRHSFKHRDSWLCYWCHDENDRLYMLEMDLNCPFRNFWQKTIEHPFPVKGSPIKHEAKDGLHYYTLTDWEIL